MNFIETSRDTDTMHYDEQWKWCEIAELRRQLKWRDLEIKCLKEENERLRSELKQHKPDNWEIQDWRQRWIF